MIPILLAGVASGLIVEGFRGAIQSSSIDEDTQKRNAKAFERQIKAQELVRENQQRVDISLQKVANRKKGILLSSMAEFLEVYERVKKIEFQSGEGIIELYGNNNRMVSVGEVRQMVNLVKQPMSDSELAVGLLFKGLGRMMVEDSKRDLAVANSRVRQANVMYSQAETLSVALNAVIERAEHMADILAKVNLLFRRSIKATYHIIETNGMDHKKYNGDDRKKLMNCMNLASAIKQILDAPLLDQNCEITDEAQKALQVGNQYLQKMSEMNEAY